MPSQVIAYPIKAPKDFLKKQADATIKELKKFVKGEGSKLLQTDMEGTVRRWEHAPDIVNEYSDTPRRTQAWIHAKGRYTLNWQRVSGGTGPRTYRSRRGTTMHFQERYTPHTTPAGIWTGPGSRSGEWRHAKVIHNHRIEPREFSKKIVAKRGAYLVARMDAITKGQWK